MSLALSRLATSTPPAKISIDHELKNRFKSDQYKIEQPYIQITVEGYTIHSEDGSETFTAARPRHILQTFAGRFAGAIAGVGAFLALGFMLMGLLKGGPETTSSLIFTAILGFLAV